MTLNVSSTKEEAIHAIAKHILELAGQYIQEKGSFTWVLSGGQTPKKLYELLAIPPFREAIDWHKVFFFFGDERFVPLTDEDSNYNMAEKALFAPLQIPKENIFHIDPSVSIEKAALQYQQTLESFFGNNELSFDLILLGMGTNLHTASLFPHDAILQETEPAVRAVKTNDKNAYRITMNAPLLNNANAVYFLVLGDDKASAVKQALKGPIDTDAFPVQLIKTKDASWFLDKAAAHTLLTSS